MAGMNRRTERIGGFLEYAFFGRSQYYEVAQWAGFDAIRAQISAYESSGLAGHSDRWRELGGLVMLQGWLSWALSYLARAPQIDKNSSLAAADLGRRQCFAITLLLTPLPWQRYYLPALPFAQLAAACAFTHLVRLLWKSPGVSTRS